MGGVTDLPRSVDDPAAASATARTCGGTTKQGLPCRITWGLDALGYCKYHTRLAAQCRGVAQSTSQRCRIKWNLNAQSFCQYHAAQAPSEPSRQCVAVAKSTGQRCRIASGLDARGLCSVHQRTQTLRCRPCRGVVHSTGEACANDAKRGYDYCCATHDPAVVYYSPRLFDAAEKSRAQLEPLVVRLYDGRDLYHGETLDLATPGGVELDHILEKQCFSFAFQGVAFNDAVDDAAFLASIVRDEVANDLDNLCLTRAATNKIKGAAVWKFLDDSITGHVATQQRFTDYLLAESRDDTRLTRATTGVIVREMGRALKKSQRKVADQGETPLLDALSTQLQHVYVTMDLHVAEPHASSRLDAAAKPFHTINDGEVDKAKHKHSNSAFPSKTASLLAEAVHAKPCVPGQTLQPETVVAPSDTRQTRSENAALSLSLVKLNHPAALSLSLVKLNHPADPDRSAKSKGTVESNETATLEVAVACVGIARSTGRRCRITWGLDAQGFCRYHKPTQS